MRMQEMKAQTERIISRIFKVYETNMNVDELNAYIGYVQGALDAIHDLELITDNRYDELCDKNYDLYVKKEPTE